MKKNKFIIATGTIAVEGYINNCARPWENDVFLFEYAEGKARAREYITKKIANIRYSLIPEIVFN
jgi:hypothetical protein